MNGWARLHAAGALLLAAAAVNWLLAGSLGHGAWLVVLGLAGIKCRVVMREFMELRDAPAAWRRAFDLWLLVLVLIVVSARWAAGGG